MSELLKTQTNETEGSDSVVERRGTERPYSAPTLRKLGGGLVEVTLGSSRSGNPDASTQYNWDEEGSTL